MTQRDLTPHNVIKDQVWQSSRRFAIPICECKGKWRSLGIKGVITVAEDVRTWYDTKLIELRLPVLEEMNIPIEWFDLAVQFHNAVGPVLVHSRSGKSRAAIFATALSLALHDFEIERDQWFVNIWGDPHWSLVKSLERWVESRRSSDAVDFLSENRRRVEEAKKKREDQSDRGT